MKIVKVKVIKVSKFRNSCIVILSYIVDLFLQEDHTIAKIAKDSGQFIYLYSLVS